MPKSYVTHGLRAFISYERLGYDPDECGYITIEVDVEPELVAEDSPLVAATPILFENLFEFYSGIKETICSEGELHLITPEMLYALKELDELLYVITLEEGVQVLRLSRTDEVSIPRKSHADLAQNKPVIAAGKSYSRLG